MIDGNNKADDDTRYKMRGTKVLDSMIKETNWAMRNDN